MVVDFDGGGFVDLILGDGFVDVDLDGDAFVGVDFGGGGFVGVIFG